MGVRCAPHEVKSQLASSLGLKSSTGGSGCFNFCSSQSPPPGQRLGKEAAPWERGATASLFSDVAAIKMPEGFKPPRADKPLSGLSATPLLKDFFLQTIIRHLSLVITKTLDHRGATFQL